MSMEHINSLVATYDAANRAYHRHVKACTRGCLYGQCETERALEARCAEVESQVLAVNAGPRAVELHRAMKAYNPKG